MLKTVEKLANEAIIVVSYEAPFDPRNDISAAQVQISEILNQTEGILYRIDNLSEAKMNWPQFLEGITVATRDTPGSMTDSRIRGILVGDYEMVRLASESMKQEQYGASQTPMFTSLDEALDYTRKTMLEGA